MLPSNTIYYSIASSVAVAGVVFSFGKWVRTKIRRSAQREIIEIMKDSFITEVAVNHLPHVYDALKHIAAALHVELPEPPPIRFVPMEGHFGTDSSRNTRGN